MASSNDEHDVRDWINFTIHIFFDTKLSIENQRELKKLNKPPQSKKIAEGECYSKFDRIEENKHGLKTEEQDKISA